MPSVGLDFESYATRNLTRVGLDNYFSDPEFMPLIGSIAMLTDQGSNAEVELDFVEDKDTAIDMMLLNLGDDIPIVAHNAMFEYLVLRKLGLSIPLSRFVDSASIARSVGADHHLRNAALQLLPGAAKMAEGRELIKKFCFPTKEGRSLVKMMHAAGTLQSDPDWAMFKKYCNMDARLSRELAAMMGFLTHSESAYELVTLDMNLIGWRVDMDAVLNMQERYELNKAALINQFYAAYEPTRTLNFNSLKQLKEWCAARGVKANSFDEQNVERILRAVQKKLDIGPMTPELEAVEALMLLKQQLGGSSLKKLQTIIDMTGEDGRLRHQYMHLGAPQTYRTSGRGVQMQNLPRLTNELDMDNLFSTADWTNEEMANNIRQVFTASDPAGHLVVGDFSSIESRGLAYMAGEDWKLDAYFKGHDLYKVLAEKIYHVDYADVTKPQRQTGKVGELSCGYGAGPGAVRDFAKKMGVDFTDEESAGIVVDWRDANPKTVELWQRLDTALKDCILLGKAQQLQLNPGMQVRFTCVWTPGSLKTQDPKAKSVVMHVENHGLPSWSRLFHGCYIAGRNVQYYKPSGKASGDQWLSYYTDPKTKRRKYYNLYGGKIAGILTQSFCREIFFYVLDRVKNWSHLHSNVQLIGQFHDEIVLDWKPAPGAISLDDCKYNLAQLMSNSPLGHKFPLAAAVQSSYRYTK